MLVEIVADREQLMSNNEPAHPQLCSMIIEILSRIGDCCQQSRVDLLMAKRSPLD
jgi:hypothetical protein